MRREGKIFLSSHTARCVGKKLRIFFSIDDWRRYCESKLKFFLYFNHCQFVLNAFEVGFHSLLLPITDCLVVIFEDYVILKVEAFYFYFLKIKKKISVSCFRVLQSQEARLLRVSANSFLEHLQLVTETMEKFGPPV